MSVYFVDEVANILLFDFHESLSHYNFEIESIGYRYTTRIYQENISRALDMLPN